ncbi:MAG: lysostaphin resistance A-like protein, partial [Flavobacteriaceae bacterium]
FIVVMGWVVGGVYEEIVFHGFIFTRLEKMTPSRHATKISFVLAGLIFGVYHYQLGMAGMINATIVGIVYLGLYVYFKRNLWYSIICHGVYNSIVMTLIYLDYL